MAFGERGLPPLPGARNFQFGEKSQRMFMEKYQYESYPGFSLPHFPLRR